VQLALRVLSQTEREHVPQQQVLCETFSASTTERDLENALHFLQS
jgi:hypothetical protein